MASQGKGREKIKELIEALPTPSALKGEKKTMREKRIRIRYDQALGRDQIRLSPKLAAILGIKDKAEVAVAGKKRLSFSVILDDSVSEEVAFANPEPLAEEGIADNSVVTIRAK